MDSTEDALKTIPSSALKPITFKSQPWLSAELEALMKSHKFSKTDAIHYGFQEWNILREQQSSASSPTSAQSETVPTPWEDIRCDFLVKIPKIGYECLNKSSDIRVFHPLMTSEICKICQKVHQEIIESEKVLQKNGLNLKPKSKLAQVIRGYDVQLAVAQQENKSNYEKATNWMKRYDERGVTIKTRDARIQDLEKEKKEWQSRETNVINRENALEKTRGEYSEKREALDNLPVLTEQVETLKGDKSILETDNEVLRKEGKEKSGQIKRLETEIEDLKKQVEEKSKDAQQKCDSFAKEKERLEAQIKDLPLLREDNEKQQDLIKVLRDEKNDILFTINKNLKDFQQYLPTLSPSCQMCVESFSLNEYRQSASKVILNLEEYLRAHQ